VEVGVGLGHAHEAIILHFRPRGRPKTFVLIHGGAVDTAAAAKNGTITATSGSIG